MKLIIGLIVAILGCAIWSATRKGNHYVYDAKGTAIETDMNGNLVETPILLLGAGTVIMPQTDIEAAREKVLEHNKELGVDTHIEELI